MILLPIVERELRVASRKPATYWQRFFLALGIWVLWFLLMTYGPGALSVSRWTLTRGPMVFRTLGTLTFAFCLLAGVILTADCLSQEKREGTIGLLFLTELKGYDVVLGKLIATSIHAFYGLGAVLPLLSYSMLVGGVTLGESCRLGLALMAALFFSLSAGMLVSARSRDVRQSMGRTALALAVSSVLVPGVGPALALLFKSTFWYFLCWSSPICTFISAFDGPYQGSGGAVRFWASLITNLGLGVGMLVLAGRGLVLSWQEKGETDEAGERSGWRWLRSHAGDAVPCAPPLVEGVASTPRTEDCTPYPVFAARAGALDNNPYYWLAGRDPRPRRKLRLFLTGFFPIWLFFVLGCVVWNGASAHFCFLVAVLMAYGLHQVLKAQMALEASRRLSEDRYSGALEPILVTPLSIEQIIAGQRRALRELFRGPIWLAVLANAVLFVLTVFVNPASLSFHSVLILCEIYLGGVLLLAVDFRALRSVGMWMALRTRRQVRANLATWGRVMLVPCAAIFVLVLLTIGGGGMTTETALSLSPLWFGLAAVIEHAFATRAEQGLLEAFRQISSAPDSPLPNPLILPEPVPASLGEA